jgi:phosphoribosylpyrophosphate synthetase
MSKYCIEYGIKFHEVDPSELFATKVRIFVPDEDLSLVRIYSPDAGSLGRAVSLARILKCPVLFKLKNRSINRKTSIIHAEKEEIDDITSGFREYYNYNDINYATSDLITGMILVIVEDEIASAGTVNETGIDLHGLGVKLLLIFATHPVLTPGWRENLINGNLFFKIALTDSMPRPYPKQTGGKIVTISLADLLGSSLFKMLNRM